MIRVDYEIKSYQFAINFILNNYIKHMRNSFANVYNQVLKGKS